MIGDVLSKLDHRDGDEDDGNRADRGPIDVAGLRVQAGFKKSELRIIQDARDGERGKGLE